MPFLLAPAAGELATSLLTAAIKSSLLLGFLLLVSRLMRHASASARHLLWVLGLASLLLLPFMEAGLPSWRVVPVPAIGRVTPLEALPREVGLAHPSGTPAGKVDSRTLQPPPITSVSSDVSNRPIQETMTSLPLVAGCFVIWLSGMLILCAALLRGTMRLRRYMREARPLGDAGWGELLHSMSRGLGLASPPTLLCSPRTLTPMTWGLRHAVVLMPSSCGQWPAELRREVLLHELAHVKRRDCLTQFAARLVCVLYWFNPLVWVAARRMRIERERACDDQVLQAGIRPSTYARHLLDIACRLDRGQRSFSVGLAMARRSRIFDRLDAVLDPKLRRRTPGPRLTLAAAALTLIAVLPLAMLGPSRSATADPTNANSWSGVWARDDRTELKVKIDGEVTFSDDETRVSAMGPEAFFAMEEKKGRHRVRVEIEPDEEGIPSYTYLVRGRVRPFDAEAKQWLAQKLPLALRQLAVNVEPRVRRIYATSGTRGVFAELEQIESDYARGAHLRAYLSLNGLTTEEIAHGLECMEAYIESDYERARLLEELASGVLTHESLQSSYFAAIEEFESEYERARLLSQLLRDWVEDARVRMAVVSAVEQVDSDYEVARLLESMPAHFTNEPSLRASFFTILEGIDSDYEKAEVLERVAPRAREDEETRAAYLHAANTIESDIEYNRVMRALRQ